VLARLALPLGAPTIPPSSNAAMTASADVQGHDNHEASATPEVTIRSTRLELSITKPVFDIVNPWKAERNAPVLWNASALAES
jgi:hypothetical protein